jgi:hypothetical protein
VTRVVDIDTTNPSVHDLGDNLTMILRFIFYNSPPRLSHYPSPPG